MFHRQFSHLINYFYLLSPFQLVLNFNSWTYNIEHWQIFRIYSLSETLFERSFSQRKIKYIKIHITLLFHHSESSLLDVIKTSKIIWKMDHLKNFNRASTQSPDLFTCSIYIVVGLSTDQFNIHTFYFYNYIFKYL